jgi:hypothetical protein
MGKRERKIFQILKAENLFLFVVCAIIFYLILLFSFSSPELGGKGVISYLIEHVGCSINLFLIIIVFSILFSYPVKKALWLLKPEPDIKKLMGYNFYINRFYVESSSPADTLKQFSENFLKNNYRVHLFNNALLIKKRFFLLFARAWVLFAFILFILSVFLSVKTRAAKEILLGENQSKRFIPNFEMESRYSWASEWKGKECYNRRSFGTLENLEITYLRPSGFKRNLIKSFIEFGLDAYISIKGERWSVENLKISSFPPTRVGRYYMFITNFGIAPGIGVRMKGNQLPGFYSHFILNNIPPGTQDSFTIEGLPYSFFFKIDLPLKKLEDNWLINKQYKMILTIKKEKKTVFEGEIWEGQKIELEGFELEILKPLTWVGIAIMKDEAVKLIFFSFTFLLIAILFLILSLLIPGLLILISTKENMVFVYVFSTSPFFKGTVLKSVKKICNF